MLQANSTFFHVYVDRNSPPPAGVFAKSAANFPPGIPFWGHLFPQISRPHFIT